MAFLGNHNVLKDSKKKTITVFAEVITYGGMANGALAIQMARDIEIQWNYPKVEILAGKTKYKIVFSVCGDYVESSDAITTSLTKNTDYKKVFIRVEKNNSKDVSYVIGNSGFFKYDNVKNQRSTTEAHELGHVWGLDHPKNTNIIGKGQPGIMYPRGTLADSEYQYDSKAKPGDDGGTLNPETRIVLLADVKSLQLDKLAYDSLGRASLGTLTNKFFSAKD